MFINAAWEIRSSSRYICRWFIAWMPSSDGGLIGAIAGYSGGGTFEVERFRAWSNNGDLNKLWIDFTDRISNEEIDFDFLPVEELLICEEALDQLWAWNDNQVWNENDNIVLIDKLLPRLMPQDGLFFYQTSTNQFLSTICKKAGLTAAP
jgi:hypothetical protein